MTQISDEYNPRFIIDDHFDKIQNKLDIIIATLLDKNKELTEKEKEEINAIWGKQIKEIKQICESHISKWPENFDRRKYELEWADLFNDTSLTSGEKIEKLKESIIKTDAILMKDEHLITKACLCVMPFFVNELNLEFAK